MRKVTKLQTKKQSDYMRYPKQPTPPSLNCSKTKVMNQQAQKLYHDFNLLSHNQYLNYLKCSFSMYKTVLQVCIPHGLIACRNYTGPIFLLVCCWCMAHNTLNKSILHCENRKTIFLAFFWKFRWNLFLICCELFLFQNCFVRR